jgi:cytochrome c oxidase subunit III
MNLIKLVHPYHLVSISPWPFLLSLTILSTAVGLVSWLNHFSVNIIPQILVILLIAFLWFRDVVREAKEGCHTSAVQRGI